MDDYLFHTDRMGFRNWQDRDLKPFIEMNLDQHVMEFFPSLMSESASREAVANQKKLITQEGYGFYAVDKLETQEFVGFIGFKKVNFEAFFTPAYEIGWRLATRFWGNGYATEGALKCLDIAKSKFGLLEMHSFTTWNNVRSQRVMEKIGMEKIGAFEHPSLAADSTLRNHVLYLKILDQAPDSTHS
ncbi:MAG: GNAT family N-acetyltransferase [Cyclobacteriaceae bacterium]